MGVKKSSSPVWIGTDDRGWDHARIHKQVLADPRTGAFEIAVYVGLAMHAETQTGECFPSVALLAEYTELSENTVRKAIKTLVDAEYVELKYKRGRANTYKLLPMPDIHTPSPHEGVVRATPSPHEGAPSPDAPQPLHQVKPNECYELVINNEEEPSEEESVDIPATLSQMREKLWPKAASS